jgi:BASS family bile acid:Na+ symporter
VAPILAGVVLGRLAPSFAARAARPLALFATVLLVVSFLPVLLRIWPGIVGAFGNFSLLAILCFVTAGLGVGHLLGGPATEDRRVLALATASRHPAVAMAVAHDTGDLLPVLGMVLVALISAAVLGAIYVKLLGRSAGPTSPGTLQSNAR